MCNRPNFEEIEEDLDRALLTTYHQWRTNRLYWADDGQPESEALIEEFINDVRNRLAQLLKNNNGGRTQ